MKKLKDNITIFQEGNNNNTTILFIHGFPFDHLMWDKQVSFLKNDFHTVTYDVRGLGKSYKGNGQFTIETLVDDLENIIDSQKLKQPVICGLSMGGYIALRAVERMENKLKALILCDTKSEADTSEAKLKRAAGIKNIDEKGIKNFVKEFIPNTFRKESIEKPGIKYKNILKRSEEFNPTGVKGCLLAMAGRTDTTDYLKKIKIPVLLICGEEDRLTPPEVMKNMADKILKSEFYIIPESAHMAPVENADSVNEKIITFLKKII